MDLLTFVAEVTKAIAWPVASVVIALVFRRHLRMLMERIRKGKLGSAEFEFEMGVRYLAEMSPAAAKPLGPDAYPSLALASTNPRAAILESWLRLESALSKFGHGTQVQRYRAGVPSAGNDSISEEDLAVIHQLRLLRNRAAHDLEFSPSVEAATWYVRLAESLIGRLTSEA